MVVYGVAAAVVFLVVLGLTRGASSLPERSGAEVPRAWRLSGWLVWASLLLGGFSGVQQLVAPLLSGLSGTVHDLVAGAVLGGVVALVVRLGAGLASRADTGLWKWGVLFQVIALGGDVLAAGATGSSAYAAAAVVPGAGLIALALAFRAPPARTPPPAPPSRRGPR